MKAATDGVIKVLSKMGISTIQSYRGAQIFEAVGIHKDVIDKYFTRTASRLGGIGMDMIEKEVLMRHRKGIHDRKDHRTGPLNQATSSNTGKRERTMRTIQVRSILSNMPAARIIMSFSKNIPLC